MNERLRLARKTLGLSQIEFGTRIGVTPGAISRLEVGSNNLTDQTIVSVCREYGINETWLRTGEGEMFQSAGNPVIKQFAEQYGLSAVFCKMLEAYINLPALQREIFEAVALRITDEARAELESKPADPTLADEAAALEQDAPPATDDYRAAWNKGLTEEEAVTLVRKRYAAAREEPAVSTTSEKAGSA